MSLRPELSALSDSLAQAIDTAATRPTLTVEYASGDPFKDESLQRAGSVQLWSVKATHESWRPRWAQLSGNRLYLYKHATSEHWKEVIPLDEVIAFHRGLPTPPREPISHQLHHTTPEESDVPDQALGIRRARSLSETANAEPLENAGSAETLQQPDSEVSSVRHWSIDRSSEAHPHEALSQATPRHPDVPVVPESQFKHHRRYVITLQLGRIHFNSFLVRMETEQEAEAWFQQLQLSKAVFESYERFVHPEPLVPHLLVIFACLRDKRTSGMSFNFEFDNTFVEDIVAHYGLAAAILFELLIRNLLVLKDKRVAVAQSSYTGIGLLDEALEIIWAKHERDEMRGKDPKRGLELEKALSQFAGVTKVKKQSWWRKMFRIRFTPTHPSSLNDIWTRTLTNATQARVIHFIPELGVWETSRTDVEDRFLSLFAQFQDTKSLATVDEREVGVIIVALSLMSFVYKDVLDTSKIFPPGTNISRTSAELLKGLKGSKAPVLTSALGQSFFAVSAQMLKLCSSLLKLSGIKPPTTSETRASGESSRYSIASRTSISGPGRFSLDQRRLSVALQPQPPSPKPRLRFYSLFHRFGRGDDDSEQGEGPEGGPPAEAPVPPLEPAPASTAQL